MTIDRFVNALVVIALVEMMATIGLGVTFVELFSVLRNWRLMLGAMLANYVCVPAVAVALLLLLKTPSAIAAGILILAVCPGAPFGPPFTALAKGNVTTAAALMALLAGSSALVAPMLLHFLLPIVSGGEGLQVDTARIVSTLLATQLGPLCAGAALRYWRPALANRLQKPAAQISKALNLAAVGSILALQFRTLLEIQPQGLAGMLALLLASWAAGWLLAGRNRADRRAMTLTTALRNVAVGLVIANGNFPGTPTISAVVAYGLFGLLGTLLLALYWSRNDAQSFHAFHF